MVIFDYIFLGIYEILYRIAYFSHEHGASEAKFHSFLLSWFVHTLNIHMLILYFDLNAIVKISGPYLICIMAALLLIGYYFAYYQSKRLDKLIKKKRKVWKSIAIVGLSVLYTIITCYLYVVTSGKL